MKRTKTGSLLPTVWAVPLPEGFHCVYAPSRDLTAPSSERPAKELNVTLDSSASMHTVSWNVAVHDLKDTISLYPGACLLYTYPAIQWGASVPPDVPTPPSAEWMVAHILMYLATNEGCRAFDLPDVVGAYPIHALTVCNTPQSIELTMKILNARPALLKQYHEHVGGNGSKCPYGGETALHIACVNRKEDVLVEMINIVADNLAPDEAAAIFCSQANGFFFEAAPMRLYGGTPLAYACVFELKRAIIALLEAGRALGIGISLNNRAHACTITGFLPIHAVVANRNANMFDYLSEGLPRQWRADTQQVTKVGRLADDFYLSLTPMQLAARFGDHANVRHILRKQCQVMWVWGPVTQFSLDLSGIDSAGAGGGDIMELIVRVDASARTTEMLLDSFMNGFIFQLFSKKWTLFGRRLHCIQLALVIALLVSEVTQTFALKSYPTLLDSRAIHAQSILHLILIVVDILDNVYTTILFDRNDRGASGETRLSNYKRLRNAYQFSAQHGLPQVLLAHTFAIAGCVMILSKSLVPFDEIKGTNQWYRQDLYAPAPPPLNPLGSIANGHRLLKGGGGGLSMSAALYRTWELYDEELWAFLWLIQATTLLLMSVHAMSISFLPSKQLSVLNNTIQRMIVDDIAPFMGVWLGMLASFYIALFVLYPRSGFATLPHVESFNTWYTALFALIDLSFIGEKVEFDLLWNEGAFNGHLSGYQYADILVWILLYYLFMLVSLVLLINLLIAMMSETFGKVVANAELQSRRSLAAHLVKLELLARARNYKTHVGEESSPGSGTFVYIFRAIDRNPNDDTDSDDGYEGDFDNGSDPFAPPEPSMQARILASISQLKDDVMSQLKSGSRGSSAIGPDGTDVGASQQLSPTPWYGAAPRRGAGIHPCNKMLRRVAHFPGKASLWQSSAVESCLSSMPSAIKASRSARRYVPSAANSSVATGP